MAKLYKCRRCGEKRRESHYSLVPSSGRRSTVCRACDESRGWSHGQKERAESQQEVAALRQVDTRVDRRTSRELGKVRREYVTTGKVFYIKRFQRTDEGHVAIIVKSLGPVATEKEVHRSEPFGSTQEATFHANACIIELKSGKPGAALLRRELKRHEAAARALRRAIGPEQRREPKPDGRQLGFMHLLNGNVDQQTATA